MLFYITFCLLMPFGLNTQIIQAQCDSLHVESAPVFRAFAVLDSVFAASERQQFVHSFSGRSKGIAGDSCALKLKCVFPEDFPADSFRFVIGRFTPSRETDNPPRYKTFHISFFVPSSQTHLPIARLDVDPETGESRYEFSAQQGKVILVLYRKPSITLRHITAISQLQTDE